MKSLQLQNVDFDSKPSLVSIVIVQLRFRSPRASFKGTQILPPLCSITLITQPITPLLNIPYSRFWVEYKSPRNAR